jgi:hypothetical protein
MSHRTICEPSEEEWAGPERITGKEVGRVAMRTQMMLLSDRDFSAFDIADLHDVMHSTGDASPRRSTWSATSA